MIIPGATHADDELIGTVAWGRGCADANFPGVYSRISYFYDWIVETACANSNDVPSYFNCPAAPTDPPTPEPTESPSPAPSPAPNDVSFKSAKQLDYLGWNPSASYPLAECQGDCDSDDNCDEGLVCFQRHSGDTAVPGCAAGTGIPAVADFCIQDPNRR